MRGLANRFLQVLALYAPGATSVRVWLHRLRGVTIGRGTFIGTDAIIETARPELVFVGNEVTISIRAIVIAHFRDTTRAERNDDGERFSVRIEDEAFVGPGAIILPGVTIGRGAVIAAGSVVTNNVPELTLVQGNPARPVARCGIPLAVKTSAKDFYRSLTPIR